MKCGKEKRMRKIIQEIKLYPANFAKIFEGFYKPTESKISE
jgi:hypothetical protein